METHRRIEAIVDDLVSLVSMERTTGYDLIKVGDTPKLANMKRLDVTHLLLGDDYIILTEATPDVIWPVDCGWAVQTEGRYVFSTFKSVTPRQVRGRVKFVAPKMLHKSTVEFFGNGQMGAVSEYLAFWGRKWIDADHKTFTRHHDTARHMPSYDAERWDYVGQVGLGLQLRHRYEWAVSIGEPNGPSFRFATDVYGIKQILDEREKEAGDRRRALRHWVVDHWRQSKMDPDVEVYVRKHLRGGERFMWRGYECEWSPAPFDVEKNEEFRRERELMGKQAVRPRADGAGTAQK